MRRIFLAIFCLVLVMAAAAGCASKTTTPALDNRQITEDFLKADSTYKFDGLPETLKQTDMEITSGGGKYTWEFDSAHAGYGDRTGQILAQVITRHIAVITAADGRVTEAIMDGTWDMKNNRYLKEIEISPAPIEEVTVSFLKSNPAQVAVYIKAGLRDGCTVFHNLEVTRNGTVVNIEVTVQRPKDAVCPAVYTTFEKYTNLGTDFTIGTTYTLTVNDYKTTFAY